MAFATTDDVATRLGRSLTEAEEAMAEQVIELVTGQIIAEVNRDAAWAAALDPVPAILTALCVEKVIVVGTNPNNLASESQQLGAAQRSRTFQRGADSGVFLTEAEGRAVRFAVYGTTSGSSRLDSVLEDYYGS